MARQQVNSPIQQIVATTPASPPSGSLKLYPKVDGNFYKLDSSGVESAVGGGMSQATADGRYLQLTGGTLSGALTVSAAITATGNVQGRWLYTTDGSNGVVQALNGDLYLRSASAATSYRMDTGAGVYVAGLMSVGAALSVGTSASIANGLTVINHTMISQATGGIGSGGASEGQLELQNAGSGASKIAFHRTGAYAAYFGLDTDNVWRIGGWSMGAVAYRILDDRDYSVGATGSKIVQRDANGYILGTYINMSADVAGGRPTYVAGNNGDNYMRWWPRASVGPPALWNWGGGNGAGVAVPYTGYYRVSVFLRCVGGSNCGDSHGWNWIYRNGGGIFYNEWNDWLNGGGTSGIVLCNAGDTLSSNAGVGTSFSEYTFWATFCPSDAYPG